MALADVLGALADDFGDIAVLPVLPRAGGGGHSRAGAGGAGGRGARRDYPGLGPQRRDRPADGCR